MNINLNPNVGTLNGPLHLQTITPAEAQSNFANILKAQLKN